MLKRKLTPVSNDCLHMSTSPDYSVDGAAGTLIVETCDKCGEKVSSTLIKKGRS